MTKRTCCTLFLTMLLAGGCCCPPASSSSGGRSTSNGDPSSGTFAFLGGLRAFFGSSNDEGRGRTDQAAEEQKAKTDEADHTAALTIR